MDTPRDLTGEILKEIAHVIKKLGGNPRTVDLTDTWRVNRTLEFLGASNYLLATIGSWKDTVTDEEVLADLRRWHEGGDEALGFDVSFVK